MNRNFDDAMDEWPETEADSEGLEEMDSSSLTSDDEVVREAPRTVSLRALRAASRRRSLSLLTGMTETTFHEELRRELGRPSPLLGETTGGSRAY